MVKHQPQFAAVASQKAAAVSKSDAEAVNGDVDGLVPNGDLELGDGDKIIEKVGSGDSQTQKAELALD